MSGTSGKGKPDKKGKKGEAGEKGENLVLTGFSFTGKSVIGQRVAERLGWELFDIDEEIARAAGKPIPQIFADDGEEHFRRLEREVLERACQGRHTVIVTGGGAIVNPLNRELLSRSGVVICLEARPETIHQRLLSSQQSSATVVRPLLAVPDPLSRITHLKASRQAFYATADLAVHTDQLTHDQVVEEVISAFEGRGNKAKRGSSHGSAEPFVVTTPSESYPVFVGWNILQDLGQRMRQVGLGGGATIISDEQVFSHHGALASESLLEAGFNIESFTVPPGETTKTIDIAERIFDWLVTRLTERGHAIVALGGGMVGDLAGFVAATFLRGLPLVQVPTSLIAMADSSIGGKVGVNHPQAKNLIGAFYQPRLVLADVSTLGTLPQRETVSGWAEVIKHGLALDADFVELLEANSERLTGLEAVATTAAIRRSAQIKAAVVSEDEKERQRRMVLNYGHTIAHGLEAATDYQRFLHGEAVAIGMAGAARLSQRLGLISSDVVERQDRLLQGFGLPTSCSGVDRDGVLKAMTLDKKIRQREIRWVLLEAIGRSVFRSDVPQRDVAEVLKELVLD